MLPIYRIVFHYQMKLDLHFGQKKKKKKKNRQINTAKFGAEHLVALKCTLNPHFAMFLLN